MSASLSFYFILLAAVAVTSMENNSHEAFPVKGCDTEEIDLLFLADNIVTSNTTTFFSDLLDYFLSPDEVLLTRLRVAMVVVRPNVSDDPSLLFSFQAYNTTVDVKKRLNSVNVPNDPQLFSIKPVLHYLLEDIRQNSTLVAIMVTNYWSSTKYNGMLETFKTYNTSRSAVFNIMVGNALEDLPSNLDLAPDLDQTTRSKHQIFLPTLEVSHLLPVRLCNKCNVKAWTMSHQSLQYERSCYFLHTHDTYLSWFEASNQCKDWGAQLVSIETNAELEFLEFTLTNRVDKDHLAIFGNNIPLFESANGAMVHIGLVRDTTRAGSPFQWVNGNPLVYTHWIDTLPTGGPSQRCGTWSILLEPDLSIYNVSDPPSIRNGWISKGCAIQDTMLALCEIMISRSSLNYEEEQIIKVLPATVDKFTSAVSRGEFIIFRNQIMSVPSLVRDSRYTKVLEENGLMFKVFDCEDEDEDTKIPYSYVCDHIDHCIFGQDERMCRYRTCNAKTEFTCRSGQCVPLESSCDVYTDCYDGSDEEHCTFCHSDMCCDGTCLPRHLAFNGEIDCIGCDARSSDESPFMYRRENVREYDCPFVCNRSECVTPFMLNDGVIQCLGPEGPLDEIWGRLEMPFEAMVFRIDDYGMFMPIEFYKWSPLCVYVKDRFGVVIGWRDMYHLRDSQKFICPEGYVKCPDSYCIPLHLVGDDNKDCPIGEDELLGLTVNCSGNFACWGGKVCVHPDLVCDVYPHCPSGDDELNCHVSCTKGFRCISGTVTVTDFDKSKTLQNVSFIDRRTRYLDLSDVNLSEIVIAGHEERFLNVIELYLSNCQIAHLDRGMMPLKETFTGVSDLDLSYNLISTLPGVSLLSYMYNLRVLNLSHNKLLASISVDAFLLTYDNTNLKISKLETLNLAFTSISVLETVMFNDLPKLKDLNISHTRISVIDQHSFPEEFNLNTLDLRHTLISSIQPGALTGVSVNKDLYSDVFKLCCPQVRGQGITEKVCHAPASAISSCMDLVEEPVLRVLLWTIGVLAVTGNIVVFAYKLIWDRAVLTKSYGLFVTNLGVSDLFMGVYLLIIAGTDVIYRDNYVWYESDWRHSTLCQTAGFLSTLSSETSAFFILLVTIDRFLVIRFPFGQFRFSRRSMILSCVFAWVTGFVLALVPTLPRFQHWEMYSSNGMCLGLPLTPDRRPGWEYAAALFIGLNFILFLFIACGQFLIYRAMSKNTLTTSLTNQATAKRVQEIMVAKQLSLVVLSDFLCWFPIGLMGLLAMSGRDIGTEAYAWSAVLVLPINSALNPVLYTVPVIMKKWENFKYGYGIKGTRTFSPRT